MIMGMFRINPEAVSNLEKLTRGTQKNGFVLIRNEDEQAVVQDHADFYAKDEALHERFHAEKPPFVLRFAKGKFVELIPADELEGVKMPYAARGFAFAKIQNGEAWRYCGMFNRHYDWTAKQWRDDYASFDGKDNPFIECFECGEKFDDDAPVYAAFTEVETERYRLRMFCRHCAERLADKLTDYKILPNGEIKIVETRSR